MTIQNRDKSYNKSYDNLKIDCDKCFGFCCVALYFSSSDGFPMNKDAGKPCINLQHNFRCAIHENLRSKGLKGCTIYDCFGAGQKVAQVTYNGHDWLEVNESANQMFEVFLIMRQIHEMLWYLLGAYTIETNSTIHQNLGYMISETERLSNLNPDSLLCLDLAAHRDKVNSLLLQTSELVRAKARSGQKTTFKRKKTMDFIGADLSKINLRGADLRGAFLIAANLRGADLSGTDLIGADMRDADIRGANLTDSMFITQSQINSAKGDANTKLPISIVPPIHWSNEK